MPELRKDPVTGRWAVIATGRPPRPSEFMRRPLPLAQPCVSCPFDYGNESRTPHELFALRNSGTRGEPGWRVRVVPHPSATLGIEGDLQRQGDGMYDKMSGIGAHEVVIESPDHAATFGELTDHQVEETLWACRERIHDLKRDRRFRYISMFRNQGEAAGALFEHPHSQLIALPVVPAGIRKELAGARNYYQQKERCIYCDIIRQESASGIRVVAETGRYLVIQPYAARAPFETWILPRHHASHFESSDGSAIHTLAEVLRSTVRRIDRALERPAWSFVLHTAPVQDAPLDHYHWHIELTPHINRQPAPEYGPGIPINPTPPEEAAQFLRDAAVA